MSDKVFVITGPSGAGKDSVIDAAKDGGLECVHMVTTSTRSMRPGEAEGQPYYFVTDEEFEKKIANGEMIEYASVYGNYYGGTKSELERIRNKEGVAIVKVDPQGARTYKQAMPEVVTIFIAPPSLELLAERLKGRASDSEEVIAKRLEVAKEEMQHLDQWDYQLVNEEGKLDETVTKLLNIIKQES